MNRNRTGELCGSCLHNVISPDRWMSRICGTCEKEGWTPAKMEVVDRVTPEIILRHAFGICDE
jgi:hypothetical protein